MLTAEAHQTSFVSPGATRRQIIVFWAKVALGLGVLTLVLRQVDGVRLAILIEGACPGHVAASVLALALAVVVNAHRWVLISKVVGEPLSFGTSIHAYFQSIFFGQILPTSIGGDAVRVVSAADAGVTYRSAIVGVLVDRALGLCASAVCLIPAAWIGSGVMTTSPTFRLLILVSVVILGGAAGGIAIGAFVPPEATVSWTRAPLGLLRAFYHTVVSRVVPMIVLDLLATTVLTLLSFVLCARAIDVNIALPDALLVLQGITLASVLPASIGGWGIREGAAVLLFAPLGLGSNQSVAISVLFGLSIAALGIFGGVIWIAEIFRRRHRRSLGRKLSA